MKWWIYIIIGIMAVALAGSIKYAAQLTAELDSVKLSLQKQSEYIEKFDGFVVELQKRQSERDAEVKAYGKELDKLAQDNIEIRSILDTALPDDVLHGLRSCGKGGAAEGPDSVD